MKCLSRWLFAVLATVMCVGMWGCGDTYYNWEKGRSAERVVGFVDDSLVMVGSVRCWNKYEESVLSISDEDLGSGCGHTQLCVYNYRVQEDGPRWCDSLDNTNDNSTLMGQLSDSVIWGGDPKSEVSFWKIGDKPYKMKIKKMFEGCSVEVPYTTKLRPWLDGKILVMGNDLNSDIDGFDLDSLGSEYCQYAVLDTIQKTVTYKRLEGDLKWIKKCDDVRAWGDDVYCLALLNEPMDLYLLKNNEFLDSLLQGSPYGWVSYTKVGFSGNLLNLGNNIFKIQGDCLFSNGVSIRNALEYKLENGNYITY